MNSGINSYRDLLVWKKSVGLVTNIYNLLPHYPKNEEFALTSQIKRAAISVPSNIAEGYGRNSTQDYIRFLNIARGSLYELETQLQISLNLKYIDDDKFDQMFQQSTEIAKMLTGLINRLKKA